MSTINIFKSLLLCFPIMATISCLNDDEYTAPNQEFDEVQIDPNSVITIDALRNLLLQEIANNGNQVLTFEDENQEVDTYISGYVVSSDEAGNFFEELLVQSDSINPSAGVRILIDSNPLFTSFEFGRRMYVKLDGLTVGIDSGVLSLGFRDRNKVSKIAESQVFDYLIRDNIVASIVPKYMTLKELSGEYTNLYIQLRDVQFNRFEVVGDNAKTFAAEPTDEFDGERILEACSEIGYVIFSTSTYADFKALLLPMGRGDLDGILTYNFYGDELNIVINDPTTIYFNSLERCDPPEISCGIADETGLNLLFSEFFESQNIGSPISGNGWTNAIEAGTVTWKAYSESGANASLGISARIGSYNSGNESSIGWLITPLINFDAQDGETLNFKTSNSFSDRSRLEVLFSNDWDGMPESISMATWYILSEAYIVQDDDFFGDWQPSGMVDLSCVTGLGYIAWKYTGSGHPDADGTFELDEIEIYSR